MKLTAAQIERFDREGYLFFPSLFSADEIRTLIDEVPALYAQRRPENVRERSGDAVRTNFAAHMYSAPFARLARHPRMIEHQPHRLHDPRKRDWPVLLLTQNPQRHDDRFAAEVLGGAQTALATDQAPTRRASGEVRRASLPG